MTTGKIIALVSLLVVGGGIAWVVHAAQREEDARAFTMARIDYTGKVSVERVHNETIPMLIKLGRRKAGDKPTDEDMRIYREARDSERAYIQACKRCASAAECEHDRQTIASGRVSITDSDTYNPCE